MILKAAPPPLERLAWDLDLLRETDRWFQIVGETTKELAK
jgi:hypothetical protein